MTSPWVQTRGTVNEKLINISSKTKKKFYFHYFLPSFVINCKPQNESFYELTVYYYWNLDILAINDVIKNIVGLNINHGIMSWKVLYFVSKKFIHWFLWTFITLMLFHLICYIFRIFNIKRRKLYNISWRKQCLYFDGNSSAKILRDPIKQNTQHCQSSGIGLYSLKLLTGKKSIRLQRFYHS